MTLYTLEGWMTGDLWWPIGVPAAKSLRVQWTDDPADRLAGMTLREIVQHIEAEQGGDFSSAPLLTADTYLTVERAKVRPHGHAVIRRRFLSVDALPSIRDYVASGVYGAVFEWGEEEEAGASLMSEAGGIR